MVCADYDSDDKRRKVRNAKELAKAIKENIDYIEVEGDFGKKVIRIKVTGKIAWAVAIAAIGVAVSAIIITIPTGGTSAPVTVAGLMPAAAVLGGGGISGMSVATTAVGIAVAGGGVGILNKLRCYQHKKISDNKVILIRK